MIRALVLVLVLAACTPGPQFVPDGYRDQSVAITSSTRFDLKRFAGDWRVIESFEQTPREVAVNRVSFEPIGGGFRYRTSAPISPLARDTENAEVTDYALGAFGRLTHDGSDPIWVIWIDEDHRTAVLGTPSGRFGMVVNRTSKLRADRLRAAREILAFNGYDLSKIRMVTP